MGLGLRPLRVFQGLLLALDLLAMGTQRLIVFTGRTQAGIERSDHRVRALVREVGGDAEGEGGDILGELLAVAVDASNPAPELAGLADLVAELANLLDEHVCLSRGGVGFQADPTHAVGPRSAPAVSIGFDPGETLLSLLEIGLFLGEVGLEPLPTADHRFML